MLAKQGELFKETEVDIYNHIFKMDVATIYNTRTKNYMADTVSIDLGEFYLYRTGFNHDIMEKKGNVFPAIYSAISKKFIKAALDSDGYYKVHFRKKYFSFHRLIALAFVNNPYPNLYDVVHHINQLKFDYRPENLQWTSQSFNNLHENRDKGVTTRRVQNLKDEYEDA